MSSHDHDFGTTERQAGRHARRAVGHAGTES
jgi:hypothetical protein